MRAYLTIVEAVGRSAQLRGLRPRSHLTRPQLNWGVSMQHALCAAMEPTAIQDSIALGWAGKRWTPYWLDLSRPAAASSESGIPQ